MTRDFSARLTRSPILPEASAGRDALSALPGLSPELGALVQGIAANAPYLSGLIPREAAWLETVLASPPEDRLADLLQATAALPDKDLAAGLRGFKRRVALLTAFCDLGGVWDGAEVTSALTRFADAALARGLRALVASEIARGKLPGQTEADIDAAAGCAILAMGKMGAFELNYSSDIDLICLFDQDRYDRRDQGEARAVLVRVTRRLMALLSDLTGDGYVFRTDLRLRPDPSVTPVCIAMEAAERYYESVGRGWERGAHIKARVAAGDFAAGDAYLERLTPFVWRKHLDFVALRDSDEMRQRIRAHKGLTGPVQVEGHNIKLGAGGIREIEFFAQTHQMISGGRDPSLRQRDTEGALRALAAAGWIDPAAAEALTTLYWGHRRIEHGLQMINDAQTHSLPRDPEAIARVARLLGQGDAEQFRRDLADRLAQTAHLTEPFFTPPDAMRAPVPPCRLPPESEALVARWPRYPALRSPRAVEIFERLKPDLLHRLDRAAHPHEALLQFDGFLSGLPAGVQLFALFEAKPQLIDLIVDICATVPALARYLSRNAGVFDAVIGGDFFAPWPGPAWLQADLAALMAAAGDYEKQLDAARRWFKEWHFRVGVHQLRGLVGVAEVAAHYGDLADAVLACVLPAVTAELTRRHGPPPGRGAAVLGMGSLGAGRLTATSDLDLIVIYDAAGVAQSDGPRPLPASQYYARLTKALVTALSAPMAEGVLYEVDMRLRPSGRQGPVATALSSFSSYQRNEAWTWEHLALTRARLVAQTGDKTLGADIEAERHAVLSLPADRARVLADVADMRARLMAAKPGDDPFEVKSGAGRITDIELLAQTAALLEGVPDQGLDAQMQAIVQAGLVDAARFAGLEAHLARLSAVNQAARLLGEKRLDPARLGQGALAFLLRAAGADDAAQLQADLQAGQTLAQEVIARALDPAAVDAAQAKPERSPDDPSA